MLNGNIAVDCFYGAWGGRGLGGRGGAGESRYVNGSCFDCQGSICLLHYAARPLPKPDDVKCMLLGPPSDPSARMSMRASCLNHVIYAHRSFLLPRIAPLPRTHVQIHRQNRPDACIC